MPSESIIFNGIKFRRYPQSKNRTERVYYVPHSGHRRKGVGRLHEEVYKTFYGTIPKGFCIHHKDENPLNNDPANLELLLRADHQRKHNAERLKDPETRRKNAEHLRAIVASGKAHEWHKTEEGRKHCRDNAKYLHGEKRKKVFSCTVCQSIYRTWNTGKNLYCGKRCQAKANRLRNADYFREYEKNRRKRKSIQSDGC